MKLRPHESVKLSNPLKLATTNLNDSTVIANLHEYKQNN